MWTTILGFAGGIAIPLLARIPAFSVDGRMVARLARDAELLKLLPPGRAAEQMEGALSESVSQLIEYRMRSVSRSATRRRVWLILFVLAASIVTGFYVGIQKRGDSPVANTGLLALVAGVLVASIFSMILAVFRIKRLRDIQNRREFDRNRAVHDARIAALDRIELEAERIYEDDNLSPRERRRRLADVSQKIDSLNELI